MDYLFRTINFSNGRRLVRIHFEDDIYDGIERFFNDDAKLLIKDMDEILSKDGKIKETTFAGNRTTITFKPDGVLIEDQWDKGTPGAFVDVEISYEEFNNIYSDWKSKIS